MGAVLLDTHALLWWLFDDPQLSNDARTTIADSENTVFVSAASVWEIATKYRLGRLDSAAPLIGDTGRWLRRAGFSELPVSVEHARQSGLWQQPHRDPFDRMLAAQSALDKLPLVSRDAALDQFGVDRIW